MPLSRYQIRNEYSLADPELYRAVDKDDPEALLEGVAMAGLVGVLRQLGDLAEFAAEIFHDLHEEAMATAARGHGLMVRVQQLEAEFPSIEKAFLSQTNHSIFFCNAGIDWHPNLHTSQNLITQGDLPRFVMDFYEECRGPPRLFLLDKFDVAGAGACLKRYTDPSFFKVEASSNGMTSAEVQRERKSRKTKKKGSRWRNGETPEVLPKSHSKLHQLFLEERVENGVSDPARLVKLKRRLNGFPFDSKTGESYMEKFLKTLSLEDKVVHEISVGSPPLKFPYNITSESGLEIVEISTVSSGKESVQGKRSSCSSPDMEKTVLKPSMDELHEDLINGGILEVPRPHPNFEAGNTSFTLHNAVEEKEMSVNGESRTDGSGDGYQSDDIPSEIDNYMDALTTMESEIETHTEFRAKNGLGVLDIENQGTDFDTNEEQLQAQSLDSQPLGNSTASDDGNNSSNKGKSNFSYSDTASTSPKNTPLDTPLDGDVSAEVFPSNENFEANITGMSSDQVSLSEEGLVTQPPEHAVSNGAFIEVPKIPKHSSEFGEPSSNSRCTDSAPVHLPVEQGAISTGGTLEGPELDVLSSNHNEYDSGFVNTEENGANLDGNFPWTANLSDVPSQTKNDSPPTVSAENRSVDKLGDDDPKVFSYALTDLENNSGAVSPEKKSRECLFDDALRTENAEESGTEDFVNSQFNSPQSVISHAEEPTFALDLSNFETCNPDVKPDSIVSVDDAITSAVEMEVNSTPAVDSPDVPVQCVSEITDDVQPLELYSAEVGIPYSGGKNLDGGLGTVAGEGMDFTPNMNLVRSDAATLGFSSDSVTCQGPALLSEVCVHSDEKETEIVQPETVVEVAAVSVPDTDANEDNVNSVTANVRKLQEECLSETRLQQNHEESGTQKEVNQHTVASPDLDSLVCNTVSYGHSEPESVNNVSDLSPAAENIFHLDDATAVSSSSKRTAQDSESKSLQQTNLIENTEDALSSPTHCFAELRVPVEQKVDVHADHHDTELLHVGEESPESFAQLENIPLNHMDQEGRDDAYSDSCPEHLPSQLTGQKVELQADQLDVESLQAGEASSEFAQFDHMQSLNHMDHERCFDFSSESCVANLPNEASVSDLVPHSGSHKLDIFEQATDPLSSVFPVIGLLPEVTQINLEEVPPLPPLPPVQWRIGKLQNASLASDREVVHHNVDHFPTMFPSKADENNQMGYPALEGDIMQPSSPFLPPSAVKDENSQVCDMMHSNPMPTMSNHINSQDDFITSGRTQSMNPFLKLPATYDERPQHGFQHGGGGIVHPSFGPFLPVATIGETASSYASGSLHELVQPQHQLRPVATLENKQLEHTVISDVKVMNPPETIVPPPTIEDEEPQNVPPAAEGETVWSSSTYYLPTIEGEKPSENHPMKLPRPRSPLIEVVAAHDKSRLRKVTKRVQPQIQKVEERDSLLEQIRTKSFNLKPAVATRPSIQGPKTNLKVAAILEKANAIRQALAGSDEDDDTDSWSDS